MSETDPSSSSAARARSAGRSPATTPRPGGDVVLTGRDPAQSPRRSTKSAAPTSGLALDLAEPKRSRRPWPTSGPVRHLAIAAIERDDNTSATTTSTGRSGS